jgi:hypothetical protein
MLVVPASMARIEVIIMNERHFFLFEPSQASNAGPIQSWQKWTAPCAGSRFPVIKLGTAELLIFIESVKWLELMNYV